MSASLTPCDIDPATRRPPAAAPPAGGPLQPPAGELKPETEDEEEKDPRRRRHARHFRAHFDEEGVYFYQAYNEQIADYALDQQTLKDAPGFSPSRMTWIKPSFAWMLCRSGYGSAESSYDRNQARVLRVKLSHESVARIVAQCVLSNDAEHVGARRRWLQSQGQGQTESQRQGLAKTAPVEARLQWDPARSLRCAELKRKKGKSWSQLQPRRESDLVVAEDSSASADHDCDPRAVQIGLGGSMSAFYCDSILSIQDFTSTAHSFAEAHRADLSDDDRSTATDALLSELFGGGSDKDALGEERVYTPRVSDEVLRRIGM